MITKFQTFITIKAAYFCSLGDWEFGKGYQKEGGCRIKTEGTKHSLDWKASRVRANNGKGIQFLSF